MRTADADLRAVLVIHDMPIERFTRRSMIDLAAAAGRIAPLLPMPVEAVVQPTPWRRAVGSDLVP